jgi:hypothetical protein
VRCAILVYKVIIFASNLAREDRRAVGDRNTLIATIFRYITDVNRVSGDDKNKQDGIDATPQF